MSSFAMVVRLLLSIAAAITSTSALVAASTANNNDGTRVKVFGLGPGRSGTESLKLALERLGFGPCYHMKEILIPNQSNPSTHGDIDRWHEAAIATLGGDSKASSKILATMLEPWGSGTDWPLAAFPDELLKAYPDAKFVLTVRDADKWYSSMTKTICNVRNGVWYMSIIKNMVPFVAPFNLLKSQIQMMEDVVTRASNNNFSFMCANRKETVRWYNERNKNIQRIIPKKQLLVFRVGIDGYEQLASFLNVPLPEDEQYPSSNSTKEFLGLIMLFKSVAIMCILLSVFTTVAFLRFLIARRVNNNVNIVDENNEKVKRS